MRGGAARWRIYAAAAAALTVAAVIVVVIRAPRQGSAPEPPRFVGTAMCGTCHQEALDAWQQSHHRHAMEPASATSVRGDFDDARFSYGGIQSRFFTREGQYFVETDGADGKLQTFAIAYTFGWYPLQQYLVQFPDGRLQALGISWDARPKDQGGQRWYHLYPDQRVTHEHPLHWTGAFQNWNARCAGCHSTALEKRYSREQDRYATRWQEVNVGCEACHGPGSRHIEWARGDRRPGDTGLAADLAAVWQPTTARPVPAAGQQGMSAQLAVCSGCHARRSELRQPLTPTAFNDDFELMPLAADLYHHDGQIREEVFEAASFMQSRMHQNHVSCSNCHEPHAGRLRATGNALCLQCHEPQRFAAREHLMHDPASPGAQCVNCHMPAQTYMGVDVRRDHSFRVPDPAASVAHGVPNACTQCHANRDDRWAAAEVAKRQGRTGPWYAHTALLAEARRHDPAAAAGLLAYAQDASRPAVLRAIMLQESARFPSQHQAEAARDALASPDPLLRIAAVTALRPIEAMQRLTLLRPVLDDPVKSVRMAAARQLADVPLSRAPAEVRAPLGKLFDEYRAALLHNADMPEAMSELAVLLMNQQDAAGAQAALLHARKLAPRYLPAMLNLADLHRARGRDDLGEPLLEEAIRAWPESGDARHMLGLLYVRTGRAARAVAPLRQATELAPDNPRYALVHAVALMETGQSTAGLTALESATRRFPADMELRNALAGYRAR